MFIAMLLLGAVHASIPPTPQVCSASVRNVGIFGGYDAFLLESGEFWFRDVHPPPEGQGLKERHYRLWPDPERSWVWDLGERIKDSRFLKLTDSKRPEDPDEGSAVIVITLCGQKAFSVRQHSSDRKPAFQIVLDWFLIRAEAAKAGGPVYEGEVQHNWTPSR